VVGASDRRGGPSKEEFNKKREKEGVGWVGSLALSSWVPLYPLLAGKFGGCSKTTNCQGAS